MDIDDSPADEEAAVQQARRVPPLRAAVTALAVVLGILAMHAVSGGPHTPRGVDHAMSGPASAVAGSASVMSGMTADVGQDLHSALGVAAAAVASLPSAVGVAVSGPAGPSSAMGAMAAMCAVVLLALVLALGFGLLGRIGPQLARTRTPSAVPARDTSSRAPPRDLLAELCVLRT